MHDEDHSLRPLQIRRRQGKYQADLLKEEMTHAWRLQKDGVIREIYGRADAPGAVIVFECGTVEEVKDHVSAFPLSKAGFLEWNLLPLIAPLPFEVWTRVGH